MVSWESGVSLSFAKMSGRAQRESKWARFVPNPPFSAPTAKRTKRKQNQFTFSKWHTFHLIQKTPSPLVFNIGLYIFINYIKKSFKNNEKFTKKISRSQNNRFYTWLTTWLTFFSNLFFIKRYINKFSTSLIFITSTTDRSISDKFLGISVMPSF